MDSHMKLLGLHHCCSEQNSNLYPLDIALTTEQKQLSYWNLLYCVHPNAYLTLTGKGINPAPGRE